MKGIFSITTFLALTSTLVSAAPLARRWPISISAAYFEIIEQSSPRLARSSLQLFRLLTEIARLIPSSLSMPYLALIQRVQANMSSGVLLLPLDLQFNCSPSFRPSLEPKRSTRILPIKTGVRPISIRLEIAFFFMAPSSLVPNLWNS